MAECDTEKDKVPITTFRISAQGSQLASWSSESTAFNLHLIQLGALGLRVAGSAVFYWVFAFLKEYIELEEVRIRDLQAKRHPQLLLSAHHAMPFRSCHFRSGHSAEPILLRPMRSIPVAGGLHLPLLNSGSLL